MKALSRIATLILSFSCLFSSISLAQDSEDKPAESLRKNAIYITGSYALVAGSVSGSFSGYYERILLMRKDNLLGLIAKAGYGKFITWGELGDIYNSQIGIITGAKSSHVEVSIGATYLSTGDYSRISPTGSIAYRYQVPGDYLVIRSGIGLSEPFFISVGISF